MEKNEEYCKKMIYIWCDMWYFSEVVTQHPQVVRASAKPVHNTLGGVKMKTLQLQLSVLFQPLVTVGAGSGVGPPKEDVGKPQ